MVTECFEHEKDFNSNLYQHSDSHNDSISFKSVNMKYPMVWSQSSHSRYCL